MGGNASNAIAGGRRRRGPNGFRARVRRIDRVGEDVPGGGLDQECRMPDKGHDRACGIALWRLPGHLGDVSGPLGSRRQEHPRHGRQRLQRRASRIEEPLPVKMVALCRHQGLILQQFKLAECIRSPQTMPRTPRSHTPVKTCSSTRRRGSSARPRRPDRYYSPASRSDGAHHREQHRLRPWNCLTLVIATAFRNVGAQPGLRVGREDARWKYSPPTVTSILSM